MPEFVENATKEECNKIIYKLAVWEIYSWQLHGLDARELETHNWSKRVGFLRS
jgi:hypothetical protein